MNILPDYILLKPTLTLCMICLCLFGCSTVPPTQYQAAVENGDNGYSHVQLSDNQYRVLFKGNKTTDEDDAKNYALLHAAELTTAQGYTWFTIVDSDLDIETKELTRVGPTTTKPVRGETTCGLLGCATPSSPNYAGGEVTTKQVKENIMSSLLITMGKGEPKTPLKVFDAKQLAQNLR
ncbi:hypothetical protein FX988_02423 [Paraglaciecola mesophila]|uniref:Lipoprotein n=1 Tax=Paraglaciecola mesophila TaxID=197222 RepID=A0A857JLF1_9ALTE|nr:hypothetical protein [Paraglaciecola mesophila]QHJ12172.1 hypothetical protein FX988_02423 [Paraglaciecola mesophila]